LVGAIGESNGTPTLTRRGAYAATVLTLVLSAGLQLAIYRHGGHTSLGDIPGRFFAWRLKPDALPYVDRRVEYPVVIGYLAYVTALVGRTATSFLALTALVNAAATLLITRLLYVRAGSRITRWALGLPVLLYAFHNWDVVALVPAVLGILAYEAGADTHAGAWLGLGFATKIFPGLLIPPLVVQRWWAGDRKAAIRLALSAGVVVLALNLPVMIASPDGWSYAARFQGARHATWGSLVSWVTSPPWGGTPFTDPASVANVIAAVGLALGLTLVTVLAVRRRLSAPAVGAAVVAIFMLTNKVYSPNYDLWLVPFFVLLPVRRWLWVAFCVADFAMFLVVFGRLHGLFSRAFTGSMVPYVVAGRACVLIALIAFSLRRPSTARAIVADAPVSAPHG
jgi:uncharacterized membrane protein